jgi:hypothetical protein
LTNIIDLSTLDRQTRRKQEREEKKARRQAFKRGELIQVASTTIGMFLQIMQAHIRHTVDVDHLKFIGDACNYQLQCFSRAYGWSVKDKASTPVQFNMSVTVDPESKRVITDFEIGGELGNDVMHVLGTMNPELQAVPLDEADDGE